MTQTPVRLGLWGARMDNSGLGMQTWEFYNHMKPAKTVVVDISMLEKTPERRMKQHPERYPDAMIIYGIPNEFDIRQFLTGLDVVFIAESAYNMGIYRIAKEMGVKTAVQYNYEFFDWFMGSVWHNDTPDLFIAPSTWHYDEVQSFCDSKKIKHVYLHCPVAREKIQSRYIGSALTFVHIAGRPAAHDRNGTYTFLNALQLAPDDLKGRVFTQDKELATEIKREFPSVDVKVNTRDYTDIYKKGSVIVLPRKYGGNCLPMNEALAAGMPVIMSKVSPQTDFLPDEWLVEAHKTDIKFAPRFPLDVYECDPAALMLKMRWFKSLDDMRMLKQSQTASDLAYSISWEIMKPKYEEVFEALCNL
jgi:glycosyltransferase involved in cell wall biosynthesis